MSCEQKTVRIVQGESKNLFITLRDKKGDPFDLTGNTAIEADFKKNDGTVLTLSVGSGVVVSSLILGKIQLTLTDVQTATLKPGDFLDFEVKVVLPSGTSIVQFLKTLNIRRQVA